MMVYTIKIEYPDGRPLFSESIMVSLMNRDFLLSEARDVISSRIESRHGPFNSKQVHDEFRVGDNKHLENMEAMATEVVSCIGQGKYAGEPISCFRGIKDNDYIFDDEEKLRQFLLLSEDAKQECDWTYQSKESPLHHEMKMLWKAQSLARRYTDDYNLMSRLNKKNTNWSDKYSCVIYREEETFRGMVTPRYELQPVPDFIRWFETEELHYLTSCRAEEVINSIEDLSMKSEQFLPSKLVDTMLRITEEIPEDVMEILALLCCVPINDLATSVNEKRLKQKRILEEGIQLESYRSHHLYKKRKFELVQICKEEGIPHKTMKKHELVKALTKDDVPVYQPKKLDNVSSALNKIKSLSVTDLRSILAENCLPTIGIKDELALRVFLKKAGKEDYISRTEVDYLLKTIEMSKEIILEEKRLSLLGVKDTFNERKYSTVTRRATLKKRADVTLQNLFHPMETFLRSFISNGIRSPEVSDAAVEVDEGDEDDYEQFFVVGSKVKVYWSKKDVKDLGWRGGWYVGYVTDFCREEDQISVQFVSERESVYCIEVTPSCEDKTLVIA